MSDYAVYNLVIYGVTTCIETILSVVTRCVVSFVVFLLLGYINKMFNIGGDSEDSEELPALTDVVPYVDPHFRNMTARAYRKHIIMLEKHVMKLQMHLDTAYRDIAALKRENDAFRRINSQAHHLIDEFKRKNSRLFLKSNTSNSARIEHKNQNSESSDVLPIETRLNTFQEDYVCIKDGDKFIFGKPIYRNEKATEEDEATDVQTVETDSGRGLCLRSVEARTDVQSSTVESCSISDASDNKQVVFICPPVNITNSDSFSSTPTVRGDASVDDVIDAIMPPPKHIYVDAGSVEAAGNVSLKKSVRISAAADDAPVPSEDNSASSKPRSVPKSVSDSKLYVHSVSSSSSTDRSSYEDSRSDRHTEDETSRESKSSSTSRSSYTSEVQSTDVSDRRSEENLTVTPEDTAVHTNNESDTLPSSTCDLPDTFTAEQRLITQSDAFKKFIKYNETNLLFPMASPFDLMSRFNMFTVFNRPK